MDQPTPASTHDWQQRPIGSLKGVGAEVERKLERLGIATLGDLARHYPRRYDDFSKIMPIRMMRPGNVTFRGEIERVASRYARARKLHLTEAIISDGTGTVKAIWFNQPYLAKTIPTGTPVLVSGQLKFVSNDLALQSPAIEAVAPGRITKDTARIVPVYPETDGLSSKQLRGLVQQLLPLINTLDETLPESVTTSAKLAPLPKALRDIHFPATQAALTKGRHRLAFEELWFLMLTALVIKHEIKTETAPQVPFDVEAAKAFVGALDFELTPAQKRAAWQIFQDLARDQPMNRLLEGDVGSGKTVVATMSAYMALRGGFQAALMVPTEILARQHAAKLTPLLQRLGYDVVVVLGKQPAAERAAAAERIGAGGALLVIGTQALLGDKLAMPNLGLVIIDEQHRFGVGQRAGLKAKAGRLPHLLSMTATPIPRSLQLTVYGELDISVIETLPPGRKPITTKVLDAPQRDKAYTFINEQIDAGRQAFVVCPLIDDSPLLEAKSATAEYDRLAKGPFAHRRLGLLHGRLSPTEKQAVMDQFAAGELDVLVATSVIEVGIDVPNAAVMLIEGAERFGLAALHQLRGRIGRGEHPSHCFLVASSKAPGTLERLRALEKSQDGFRLAQIDLELRGPGQIYGRRQHGTLDVQLADTTDVKFLAAVRGEALKFLSDPAAMIKYPEVAAKVNALKAVTSLD
ncbi:MAG TPA: ATP-dependent DNA helicase RecG [Candidatus Saccharimonadia bacterium]|nr:ATP-dependent DNA helicase RecG [Candidatus Saccharimonadia bacterium]